MGILSRYAGERSASVISEKDYCVPSHPEDRRGFSEQYIRGCLERRGWEVWRGGFLHANRASDVYPNVARRYREVERLLDSRLAVLQYVGVVHHGMPDLLCYKHGAFKFVECKLGYESLSERQRKTIRFLLSIGFDVEVHCVVEHQTRRREARYDLESREREVLCEQRRLADYTG